MIAQRYEFERRIVCPACASDLATTRFDASFSNPAIAKYLRDAYRIDAAILRDGNYRLDQCGQCATVYQVDVGTNHLLSTLYSEWVHHYEAPEDDANYAYDMAHPRKSRDAHEIMAAAAHLGVPLAGLVTLDYGMGWAGWARVAATLGCQSFGSDIATDRMEFARKHRVTPLLDGEIGERRFHFINTEQAMEHMTDPAAVTARLAAALRPGGILKISVPSSKGADAVIAKLNGGADQMRFDEIIPVQPLEHVNTFTFAGLTAMGKRAGLSPVRPTLRERYAFLSAADTLDVQDPKRLLKELVRPVYQYRNPRNLYVWLRRPA